jgi:phosphoribosylformylglycinamidine synthase subunit PurS
VARERCSEKLPLKANPPDRHSVTQRGFMKARIRITLKEGVLDPQGKAIENALASLGFQGIEDVRQGKYIELLLSETEEARAREQLERMCRELLANTVIENYSYELVSR